jgi:NAD(P)-dependent dehydrogenase (short-subunit alcohol dehydrogenase family)
MTGPADERAWIVTGASRGIGAAVAHRAVARGDRVTLVSRGAGCEELARELSAAGGRVNAVREDVAAAGAAKRIVAAAIAAHGRVDVLVNNAGAHRGGRLERLDPDDFDAVLGVNLQGPFRLCQAAAQEMADGGAIVNVGSVVGFRGFPGDAPYAASKMGAVGLTYVLALELARRGITANVVVPGFTETELTGALDERAREDLVRRIPLRRSASPQEIAEVVGWVAQTPYMTGAVIPVDGGLMAALGAR